MGESQAIEQTMSAIRSLIREMRMNTRAIESKAGMSLAQLFVLHCLAEKSADSLNELAERTATLARQSIVPGLAVVLVGDDPASQVYVGSKTKQAEAAGIRHFDHRLPASTTELGSAATPSTSRATTRRTLVSTTGCR